MPHDACCITGSSSSDAEMMSLVAEENMTSPVNATHVDVTYLWLHAVPSSAAWWSCLVCMAVATIGVNVVTCLVLMVDRSLQTTLYTYLTSLTISDVIGSALVTVIVAVRTSLMHGQYQILHNATLNINAYNNKSAQSYLGRGPRHGGLQPACVPARGGLVRRRVHL